MINNNSPELLEFGKLRVIITGFANSDSSTKQILNICPLDDREAIEKRQSQVREILKIASEGFSLPLSEFADISDLIAKTRPEGAVLDPFELAGFISVLAIASDVSLQLKDRADLPFLSELAGALTGFPDILKVLKRSIDTEGNILSSASSFLSELRSQIRRIESRIRKKLEDMVRDSSLSVFLQDNFITTRSGRWVIPVRMDAKGEVPGVVHDVSKSGETAFIEPLGIISVVNELENLLAEQKAEEIRILRDLTSRIRTVSVELTEEYKTLVYIDVINAIAGFAATLGMELPQLNGSGALYIVNGRHPLLTLALRKAGEARQVVPLDVRLGGDSTVMVITGSNAGGKTIAIKTIGLLLLMALSGMPVPADSASSFPLADNLLIDIGDEQSIENNLSTFSAHVSNISGILKKAGPKAVILIDELGTGTDPDEGAAIACSVLNELRTSGALVFATTHLTGIKGFVHRTDGMLNASMDFDQTTLTPLFRLRTGEPGRSHAIDIAQKYGLPDSIIDSARKMLGGVKAEFDNLIADLNDKRARYEKELAEISLQRSEIEKERKELAQKLTGAENQSRELMTKACTEAEQIISGAKREVYAALEEIKKKDRDRMREAAKKLEDARRQAAEKLGSYDRSDSCTPSIDEIMEGDIVFVRSLGYDAPVVEINLKHNRLKVMAGSKEIDVPVSDTETKKGRSVQTERKATGRDDNDRAAESRINLVGLRVDEALSRLEPFLNHASLDGLQEVTVIHGIGTGILARAVREHLNRHPLLKGFRKGDTNEGGGGVTIATLA